MNLNKLNLELAFVKLYIVDYVLPLVSANFMWNNESLWFEVAVVTIFFLLGHIYFGHFEERSPKGRKVLKYIVTLAIMLALSVNAGRAVAFIVHGLACLPVIYIHGFYLPKKGINGWTGEPKGRYYDFRGWSKNILGDENK